MSTATTPKRVALNGTTTGYDASVSNDFVLALLQNGGLRRIQGTLTQRLDEAGWSQNLREYITKLFRSGEAVTYDDALAIVMKAVHGGESVDGAPDLSLPEEAKVDGAEAVKRELRAVAVAKK